MSYHLERGTGGRNIIPRARKSIHSHSSYNFTRRVEMVRYGDDSSDEELLNQDAGSDEVDNVMSKFAFTSTPLQMRKFRRNSMTPPNQQYTDDSDDNALAKSLPAALPSYSNCSINFEVPSSCNAQVRRQVNKLLESTTPGATSTDSRNTSYASRSPSLSPRLNHSTREQVQKPSGTTKYLLTLLLLSIASATYLFQFLNSSLQSDHIYYDERKFRNDLSELGAKYKVADDSILQLQAGISTIFKREDTSCLIFVYNSKKEDFDSNKFYSFVDNVASNSAKFLRNDTTSLQHKVVEGSTLNMGSHTQLVKAYREDVARTGVLLIRDVEHVPSPLAMAFHYYCDEYNPLVKKSAIFFTLNTAQCHNSGEKSSHAAVETCLKKKWNTVPQDNIGPLLTRVVSIVVDVTNGFSV